VQPVACILTQQVFFHGILIRTERPTMNRGEKCFMSVQKNYEFAFQGKAFTMRSFSWEMTSPLFKGFFCLTVHFEGEGFFKL